MRVRRRRRANLWLAAVLAGTGLVGATLYVYPPGVAGFYPACPFQEWTGWLCPGCGGTRAVAALVHGRLAEAMRWNGLVILELALGAGWAAVAYGRVVLGRERAWVRVRRAVVVGWVAGAIVFGVMRNLG